jgi:hypothetical protein
MFIILFVFFPFYTNANNVNPLIENWFKNFSFKIQIKYSNESEIKYFKSFNEKLENLKLIKKLNSNQTNIINDLIKLSNELIFNIQRTQEEKENKKILNKYNFLRNFKYKSLNKEHIFLKD